MDREQAINYLRSSGFSEEQITAIEQAFNGEPCEDAISRQAALALTKEIKVPIGNAYMYYSHVCIDPQDIIDLPPVTVQEKTGHWEWIQYDSNPNIGNWHCSECNRIVCGAITAANPVYAYKYCPNCGCRMVEPQESEDAE